MTPLPLRQVHIDWLLKAGVTISAMIHPAAILLARGADGSEMLYFQDDEVFWHPKSGATHGHWCLGEDAINDPGTYSFDGSLEVHATPLDWLLAGREGICVVDWKQAYIGLRDVPRVTLNRNIADRYRGAMRAKLPSVSYSE